MTPQRSHGEWTIAIRQQAAVARVGQLGLQGIDLDALMNEGLAEVADTLGLGSVALLQLDATSSSFSVLAAIVNGRLMARRVLDEVRVPVGTESMPGYTVLQRTATVSSDLLNDERFRARAPEYGMSPKAAIIAPVGWGDKPWGVLASYSDDRREWTDDDVHFVQSMANTIGLAIARHRAEGALEETTARLEISLSAGGLGAWTWNVSAGVVDLSPQARDLCGVGPDFDGDSEHFFALIHPDDRAVLRSDAFESLQTTGEIHTHYRLIRPSDGSVRWFEIWGRVVEEADQQDRLVGVLADITDRRQADETKERLLAAEQQARASAEHSRERQAVLAEASAQFSDSLDSDVIAGLLPGFCVPLLADVCMVDVFDDGGRLVEAGANAVDEHLIDVKRALRRYRVGEVSPWSERRAVGRRESILRPSITDEDYQAEAKNADQLELFRRLGARSSLAVPLVARDRVLGVLTLVTTRPGRTYSGDLVSFAEDLVSRAALALDNARLYESLSRVARSLQAALLPPALPFVEGLQLGARYRVAEDEIKIGGDFYDIIEFDDGNWGVVVGDVCGRGPDAAALTGLMRHSVRTAVVRETLPSRVLSQTNEAVLDQIDDSRFCTAAYLRVELDPARGQSARLLAASAGHPPPAILRADGTTEVLACSGLVLGVAPSITLPDVQADLNPGDAVILYTDGVTEARRGDDLFGEERLLDALSELAGLDANGIAQGIDDAVIRFATEANDDVAVFVLRIPPVEG